MAKSTPTPADTLLDDVLALRKSIAQPAGPSDNSLHENLAHYLALRHRDLRELQRRLMYHGLSSLGRLESRVLPTLDAVLYALAGITGRKVPFPHPTEAEFFAGETRLAAATELLFGAPPAHRRSRIMVTLPSEAAGDPEMIIDLARRGMDVARINCAHDDSNAWRAMAANARKADALVGHKVMVLMDIAGPKIRTELVLAHGKHARLEVGDMFRLVASGPPRPTPDVPVSASVSLPDMVNRLAAGHLVRYDDGKLEGVVESAAGGEAVIRVTKTKAGGTKLKPEKGLNLPDTALGLSPLTAKDDRDLATIVECTDMIGYSFVSRPQDIDLLEDALAHHGAADRKLGLIAKIERPEAVTNLPELIRRVAGRRPFGVMIARGDLAAEIGFERVAEMQEEILWICEAAAVPAIWATQVLEELVKNGIYTRAEMTDAAMAGRAECVMLNKGPEVGAAIEVLDRLLTRMDAHMFKKTPTLRALKSW